MALALGISPMSPSTGTATGGSDLFSPKALYVDWLVRDKEVLENFLTNLVRKLEKGERLLGGLVKCSNFDILRG